MTRTRTFWATLALLGLLGSFFALKLFPMAFPLLSVDIAMSRAQALDQARELSVSEGWGPDGYRQAASFSHLDRAFQTYMELEGGGLERLNRLVQADTFQLYAWRVRHFAPGEIREVEIRFTPEGALHGFRLTLPEDAPGQRLSVDEAESLARAEARNRWEIPLEGYQLLESSLEEMPGGRLDHTFTFQDSTLALGDSRLRLRLTLSGDRLTEITPFFHVPEAFLQRYQDTRNANESISLAGTAVFFLLFLGMGGGLGAAHLLKKRRYEWKVPLGWGVVVAGLMAMGALNGLPLSWMGYDTALPPGVYTGTQVVSVALTFLAGSVLLALLFMVGEGMMRLGFPSQIQQWRLWSPQVANTDAALGRTLAPYLVVGAELGFVVAFYLVTSRWAGWWSPASAMAEPDLLATHFPWLTAVSTSLFAAFSEETIFRAIPIGVAAYWGRRRGNAGAWIWGAVVLQAVVFGASHANYPQQPPYARVVEIFPIYLGWGIVCVYFGLIPSIIGHYLYDLILFSLPLFAAHSQGIWIDRGMVIVAGVLPLLVILWARLRHGARAHVPEQALNRSWRRPPDSQVPPGEEGSTGDELTAGAEAPARDEEPAGGAEPARDGSAGRGGEPTQEAGLPVRANTGRNMIPFRYWILLGAGALGALVLWARHLDPGAAPRLSQNRVEAESAARDALEARGVNLAPDWLPQLTITSNQGLDHQFVWRRGGEEAYQDLLGTFLNQPRWRIRFVHFQASPEERTESFTVRISPRGTADRISHVLPEGRPGSSLEEEEARTLAEATLNREFGRSREEVREVSAQETAHPERTDWTFTYTALRGYPLDVGEGRIQIQIAGSEVVDARRFVFVPEEWERGWGSDRSRRALAQLIPMGLLLLGGLGALIRGVVLWARGTLHLPPLKSLTPAVATGLVLVAGNGWPATQSAFTTDLSLTNQVVVAAVGMVIGAVLLGLVIGMAGSLGWTWLLPGPPRVKGGPWAGAALGLISVAGLTALSEWLAGGPPPWPDYSDALTFYPAAAAALGPILGFLILSAGTLLVMGALERAAGTRLVFGSALFLLLIGLMMAPNPTDGSWAGWVAGGVGVGAAVGSFWVLGRKWGWNLVPGAAAAIVLAGSAEALLSAPVPGTVPGTGIGIAGVLVMAYAWARAM